MRLCKGFRECGAEGPKVQGAGSMGAKRPGSSGQGAFWALYQRISHDFYFDLSPLPKIPLIQGANGRNFREQGDGKII